jgi:tartrate dehydratase beta subunit/fumarate hydratase class I family protein
MIKLSFPFTEEKIRALKVGDEVLISGIVFTGRDARTCQNLSLAVDSSHERD